MELTETTKKFMGIKSAKIEKQSLTVVSNVSKSTYETACSYAAMHNNEAALVNSYSLSDMLKETKDGYFFEEDYNLLANIKTDWVFISTH